VLGVTESSDQGDDREAEGVVGEGEVGFGLGSVGAVIAGTAGLCAASDLAGQSGHGVEGGDRAVVGVIKVQAVAPLGAAGRDRLERLGVGGNACVAWVKPPGLVPTLPTQLMLVKCATVEKTTGRGFAPAARRVHRACCF
jgi:hypothetical protein